MSLTARGSSGSSTVTLWMGCDTERANHIRQVPSLAAWDFVVHEVVVAGGDVEAVAQLAVELVDAHLPVGEGIGIGVYGDLVAEEGP